MPTNVARQPTPQRLRALNVANPCSAAGHASRWSQDLAFLLAWCVEVVGSKRGPNDASADGTTRDISFLYARSPGAKVLLVAVDLPYGAVAGSAQQCTISLPSATWIAAHDLDGSNDLQPPIQQNITFPQHIGVLDVSNVPVGVIQELKFTYRRSGVGGFSMLHAVEVPLSDIDPFGFPSDEVGVAEPTTHDRIVDGNGGALGYGLQRVITELDRARTQVRRHIQMLTLAQGTGVLEALAVTTTTLTPIGAAPRVRARRLYAKTVPNHYTLGVVYKTSSASVGGKLRVSVTPVGGVLTSYDLTLPASTSWTMATMDVPLPTSSGADPLGSGTTQLCEVRLSANVATGGNTVYIATAALVENES